MSYLSGPGMRFGFLRAAHAIKAAATINALSPRYRSGAAILDW
jgi:hypothetical protein